MKSMLHLAGRAIVPELYTRQVIRVHPRYLFWLIGFGIGSILSFISLVLEEYEIDFPSGPSHLPHLIVPLLFGIIGTVIGFFFEKKRQNKEEAFQEIFANHQTMSLILDHLPVLISYLDTDLCFRYANKAYEIWMGLTMQDIYGKSIKDSVSGKSFEMIMLNLPKTTKGETISFESSEIFNGEERFLNSVMVPHFGPDKKVKGFFTIVTDITKLRKRENKIKKQKNELAELNATKDKFFSVIAHDLKNPFNSLLGFSEILHNDFDFLEEAIKKKYILFIYEITNNTYKLLENLLAWSQTQTGKIVFNPSTVNIKEVVEENLKLLGQTAAIKNIHLQSEFNNNCYLYTDHDLINSVIRNLLSNAIKFTPKDGLVNISVNPVPGIQSNEFLEIVIADTGLGIASKNLKKLFKIGESKSSSGTEGESGTGLGLLLCKEFVEKCGGKIGVESEVGKGSKFTVTLPNR